MTGGEAANWKQQFLTKAKKQPIFDLGAYDAFVKALETSFTPYDATGEALEKMKWTQTWIPPPRWSSTCFENPYLLVSKPDFLLYKTPQKRWRIGMTRQSNMLTCGFE